VTNDKLEPPKTEKCPTCGGEAKLDERRYTEDSQVAYSCRNGLSHYFFDTDPHLEVRRLRSELDRAFKRIEALRQMRDSMNRGDYDCMDWCDKTSPCQNCRTKMTIDAILSDAPTENKSNER
jgi:hypothetical protein